MGRNRQKAKLFGGEAHFPILTCKYLATSQISEIGLFGRFPKFSDSLRNQAEMSDFVDSAHFWPSAKLLGLAPNLWVARQVFGAANPTAPKSLRLFVATFCLAKALAFWPSANSAQDFGSAKGFPSTPPFPKRPRREASLHSSAALSFRKKVPKETVSESYRFLDEGSEAIASDPGNRITDPISRFLGFLGP